MSGVYTSLAKKRAEQNKEAIIPSRLPTDQQSTRLSPPLDMNNPLPQKVSQKNNELSSSDQLIKKNSKNLAEGKTQISAVVTYEQKAVILDLETKFNRRNKVVGKGDIAGIGLDTVSRILNRPTPLFSSLEEIKDYVNGIIDKALKT